MAKSKTKTYYQLFHGRIISKMAKQQVCCWKFVPIAFNHIYNNSKSTHVLVLVGDYCNYVSWKMFYQQLFTCSISICFQHLLSILDSYKLVQSLTKQKLDESCTTIFCVCIYKVSHMDWCKNRSSPISGSFFCF